MAITFTPATKKQAKARIALEGPSGSGKTYSALRIATGLGGRIAVLDTEHGSASKYADEFRFDTLALTAYDPRTLIDALAAAGSAGYDVFIVDSLSHFWMGVDGMLEQVDRAAKRSAGGNTFGGWKDVSPIERRMIDAMLAYPGHLIVTMRTKTEWVIEENDRGRKVPRKVGMKAVQRDGIEYEFDVVGDLNQDNELVISKSRCKVLSGQVIPRPGGDLAKVLREWLDDGSPAGPTAVSLRDEALKPGRTRDELRGLYEQAVQVGCLGVTVVDGTGESVTLADLLIALGRQVAAAPTTNESPDGHLISEAQSKRLHAMLREAGITDHDDKLRFVSEVVGRDIATTGELTRAEAGAVMDSLQMAADEPVGADR